MLGGKGAPLSDISRHQISCAQRKSPTLLHSPDNDEFSADGSSEVLQESTSLCYPLDGFRRKEQISLQKGPDCGPSSPDSCPEVLQGCGGLPYLSFGLLVLRDLPFHQGRDSGPNPLRLHSTATWQWGLGTPSFCSPLRANTGHSQCCEGSPQAFQGCSWYHLLLSL